MVYEALGKQVLENAWQGYHCCLFAYGQTGAGKSYSMVSRLLCLYFNRLVMERIKELFLFHVTRFSKELEATLIAIGSIKSNSQCLKFITRRSKTSSLPIHRRNPREGWRWGRVRVGLCMCKGWASTLSILTKWSHRRWTRVTITDPSDQLSWTKHQVELTQSSLLSLSRFTLKMAEKLRNSQLSTW